MRAQQRRVWALNVKNIHARGFPKHCAAPEYCPVEANHDIDGTTRCISTRGKQRLPIHDTGALDESANETGLLCAACIAAVEEKRVL